MPAAAAAAATLGLGGNKPENLLEFLKNSLNTYTSEFYSIWGYKYSYGLNGW